MKDLALLLIAISPSILEFVRWVINRSERKWKEDDLESWMAKYAEVNLEKGDTPAIIQLKLTAARNMYTLMHR